MSQEICFTVKNHLPEEIVWPKTFLLARAQTWKKFVHFRDPTLEFSIISAKYPTKTQQYRHITTINDRFFL